MHVARAGADAQIREPITVDKRYARAHTIIRHDKEDIVLPLVRSCPSTLVYLAVDCVVVRVVCDGVNSATMW